MKLQLTFSLLLIGLGVGSAFGQETPGLSNSIGLPPFAKHREPQPNKSWVDLTVEQNKEKAARPPFAERKRFGQKVEVPSVPFNGNVAVNKEGRTLKAFGVQGYAQQYQEEEVSPLGDLPPVPDIRTPQQKTWLEKRKEERVEKFEARQAANEQLEESKAIELEEARVANGDRERFAQQPDVPNVMFNGSAAVGKDGKPLKAFGVQGYAQQAYLEEESSPLGDLPAVPDIRTPTQKTWLELQREKRAEKYEERQASMAALKASKSGE